MGNLSKIVRSILRGAQEDQDKNSKPTHKHARSRYTKVSPELMQVIRMYRSIVECHDTVSIRVSPNKTFTISGGQLDTHR